MQLQVSDLSSTSCSSAYYHSPSLITRLISSFLSYSHLPEISEEALTKEMGQKGLSQDVGPFYKQYRCIFGFVAQMCYEYVPCPSARVFNSSHLLKAALKSQWHPSWRQTGRIQSPPVNVTLDKLFVANPLRTATIQKSPLC